MSWFHKRMGRSCSGVTYLINGIRYNMRAMANLSRGTKECLTTFHENGDRAARDMRHRFICGKGVAEWKRIHHPQERGDYDDRKVNTRQLLSIYGISSPFSA